MRLDFRQPIHLMDHDTSQCICSFKIRPIIRSYSGDFFAFRCLEIVTLTSLLVNLGVSVISVAILILRDRK